MPKRAFWARASTETCVKRTQLFCTTFQKIVHLYHPLLRVCSHIFPIIPLLDSGKAVRICFPNALLDLNYDTSLTVRGAAEIILQHHQIFRLPRDMAFIIDRCHAWNVICNTRSNMIHPLNSPNTVPAMKDLLHDWVSWRSKKKGKNYKPKKNSSCTPNNAQYYSVPLLQYYKARLQYHEILPSITVILQCCSVLPCTTKYYSSTTLYYKDLLRTTKYYKVPAQVLQRTTPYYKVLLQY